MARRRREDEPKQGATWLATYGDMVTLLLCFFVLLYSFSSLDMAKFRQVAISLQSALRGVLVGGVALGPHDVLEDEREQEQLDEAFSEIDRYLQESGLKGAVVVQYEERGLVIRFLDTVLFDLARADLKSEALGILDKISEVLHKVPNQVAVEGHTDNLPIHTSEFPSNWWLSTARANRVVEYFISRCGLSPARLSVVGYGEYRPLVPNTSETNRAQNRRVEILIKKSTVGAFEPR